MPVKNLQHPLIIFLALVSISSFLGKIFINILPPLPVISDSLKYIKIANGINDGSYPAIEGIYYSPGYPYFLSKVFTWFGSDPTTVYQVQFFLLGVAAFLTYNLAKTYLQIPVWLSLVASLAVISWPYMILYSLLVMSAIPYIVIFLLAVTLVLKALSEEKVMWFALAGVIFGLAALMRPVALLLPFWLLGIGILLSILGHYRMPPFKNLIIGMLCFLLVVSPWFAFKNIETAKNPTTSAQSSHVFDKSFITLSYETDRNPDAPVHLSDIVVSKFKNFFLFWNPGAGGYQAEMLVEKKPTAKYLIELYKFGFLLLLALALAASLFIRNNNLLLIWSIILYAWALHTILFPYPRYTLPVIPLMLVSAAFAIANWHTMINKLKLPTRTK